MSKKPRAKLLLVSHYFWPEPFKVSELAVELDKLGFDITVVTSIPNYPDGLLYEEYSDDKTKFSTLCNVNVIRVWQVLRGNNKFSLLLNYITFAIMASLFLIKHYFKGFRYDLVIAAQLSPITSVIPAIIFSKLSGVKIIYWVFDIWPDSIFSGARKSIIYRLAIFLCAAIYKRADRLFVTSNAFVDRLINMGIHSSRTGYLPQWASIESARLDTNIGLHPEIFPSSVNGIKVLFTGNIGTAQNLEEVIIGLKVSGVSDHYCFCFVGSGRSLRQLKRIVAHHGLNSSVMFIPRQPPESLPQFYAQADLLLLPLKSNPVFDLTLPAKLQGYMATGKPILAMVTGEAKRVVEEADCGFVSASNDRYGYAKLLQECVGLSKLQLDEKGANGLEYCGRYFDKKVIVNAFAAEIEHEISNL